ALDVADRGERDDLARDVEPAQHIHDGGQVLVGEPRLPVPDGNAVARHHLIEAPDIAGRDLMAEAPRSAMEHHTHLPRRADPERPGRHRIVDALGPYQLDLKVVVTRAQR